MCLIVLNFSRSDSKNSDRGGRENAAYLDKDGIIHWLPSENICVEKIGL